MKVINEKEVRNALEKNDKNWNFDAIIDAAEEYAMINGHTDEDFTYDSDYPKFSVAFDCVKPTIYEYDEDGEIVQDLEEAEYWIRIFALTKNGGYEIVYCDPYKEK